VGEQQSGDELIAAFGRWAAGQRAEAAAAGRARERWLRTQAGAGATWTGVLVDLAEQSGPVVVVSGSRRWRGALVGVGPDFCVLDATPRRPVLVALAALSAVWAEGAGPMPAGGSGTGPGVADPSGAPVASGRSGPAVASAGDRRPTLQLSWLAALSMLAEDRHPVSLTAVGGEELVGTLVGVGEDVLTLQTDPPARRLAYLPVGALASCELR
jgi:hypothetical protein